MTWGHAPGPNRWDPFREFQREVGRLLESIDPRHFRFPRPYPALNLLDGEDCYVLTAELPGMSAENLDLTISGETLTMRGERSRPEGVLDESYRRQERMFGSWSRSLTLPGRVDAARVSANFQNGVLTVSLPKIESVPPRQIPVTTGKG